MRHVRPRAASRCSRSASGRSTFVASVFAALSVVLWIGGYAGFLPQVYGGNPVRHAHEMIYGFAVAVIVGFLFTAGRNWSGRPTPHGPLLAAFVALWLAGRLLAFTPWTLAAALVSAAFPVAAAAALAVPFVQSGLRRNYFFVGLLVAIGAADLGVQLASSGVDRVAGARRIACGPRHRAVDHGGDRRSRDPDVHEQRDSRRRRLAPAVRSRCSRSDRSPR